MSVVGFDFGNDTCKVAVAKRGAIEVVQNESGHRSTPAMVAYGDRQRAIGTDALSKYTSNYRNTVKSMKRFLGRDPNAADMKQELQFQPFAIVPLGENRVGFQVQYDGKETTVSVEQVTAAMISKLKKIASAGLEQKVVDCVISCPSYWTDRQRRALLDAARLAGLNVLRVMNETTAVALNYGILRPLPADTTQNVCFVDVGYCSTNVALVSFKQGKLKVLSTASDARLGAKDFDTLLLKHLAAEIQEKYNLDVLSNPKATLKLYKECARVKKVLSANTVVQYNVEYIMNDKDVSGQITRDQFEELARAELLPRLLEPVGVAFKTAGVEIASIHSVEVVGGGVRIPCVQRALTDFFGGKSISKTCDGDESVARGCALQCAMLSPSFKVRDFEVQDCTPYAVQVEWGNTPAAGEPFVAEGKAQILMKVGNPIPSVKMMTFNQRQEPMTIVASYEAKAPIPLSTSSRVISTFNISGMPSEEREDASRPPRIKVKLRMDMNSVVSLASAQWVEEITYTEPAPAVTAPPAQADAKTAPTAASTAPENKGAMDTDTDPDAESAETKQPEDTPMGTDETPSTNPGAEEPTPGSPEDEVNEAPASADPAVPAPPAETATEPPAPKRKKRTIRTDLTVTTAMFGGMTERQFNDEYERESAMAGQDLQVEQTHIARNNLESYVLEMRSAVQHGPLKDYIKPEDAAQFAKDLTATEDWLYEDEGYDAQKSEYVRRLVELEERGRLVKQRKWEDENREAACQALKKTIVSYQMFTESTDEKYAHISAEDKAPLVKECKEADDWLVHCLQLQDSLTKADDPAVTVAQLHEKNRKVDGVGAPIMNKPAPKPAEEKKGDEAKDAEAMGDEAKASTEDAAAPADDATDAGTSAADDVTMDPAPEAAPADGAAPMDVDVDDPPASS